VEEDLETFDVVLSQYAAVENVDAVEGLEARSGTSGSPSAGTAKAGGVDISRHIILSDARPAFSSSYVSKTIPNEKPLEFSGSTRTAIRRVHHISGVAVKVTAKTTAKTTVLINQAVESAMHRLSGSPNSTKMQSGRANSTPAWAYRYQPRLDVSGPPLPSRTPEGALDVSPSAALSGHFSSFHFLGQRTNTSSNPSVPSPPLNRVLLSTDLLLTTLESSGKHLLEHQTQRGGGTQARQRRRHSHAPDGPVRLHRRTRARRTSRRSSGNGMWSLVLLRLLLLGRRGQMLVRVRVRVWWVHRFRRNEGVLRCNTCSY